MFTIHVASHYLWHKNGDWSKKSCGICVQKLPYHGSVAATSGRMDTDIPSHSNSLQFRSKMNDSCTSHRQFFAQIHSRLEKKQPYPHTRCFVTAILCCQAMSIVRHKLWHAAHLRSHMIEWKMIRQKTQTPNAIFSHYNLLLLRNDLLPCEMEALDPGSNYASCCPT